LRDKDDREREEERKKNKDQKPQSNGPNSPSIAGEPMYKRTSGERKSYHHKTKVSRVSWGKGKAKKRMEP
jgi:hypothetical protein